MPAGHIAEHRDATATGSGKVPSRIPGCAIHHQSGRNLVVCIDGTSNQFGKQNTSVVELYHLLPKSKTQITYYNSGIGTYARPSWRSLTYWMQVLGNVIDLGIAWNLEKIIIDAYRWLSDMYEDGDRIFLFGFSRGAYQVRALSAMIHKVGLIHKGNQGQIPFAYELYADPISHTKPFGTSQAAYDAQKAEYEKSTMRFKEAFSREVFIHFVGAWDTVSSVGFVRSRTLPATTEGMLHVCHFRHALALDERRVKFLPEYAYGGAAQPAADTSNVRQSRRMLPETTVKVQVDSREVWFAGTHSDIGGGNTENTDMNRSGPPLMWMLSEAVACGLHVSTNTSENWNWQNTHPPHESLSLAWWLFEVLPIKCLSYKSMDGVTRWPHLGRGRTIVEGQCIHSSVASAKFVKPQSSGLLGTVLLLVKRQGHSPKRLIEGDYTPRARLPNKGESWATLFNNEQSWAEVRENDLYDKVRQFSAKLDDWADKETLDDSQVQKLNTELAVLTQTDVDCWALGIIPSVSQSLLKVLVKVQNPKSRSALFQYFNSILGGRGHMGNLTVFLPFDERLLSLWRKVNQEAKRFGKCGIQFVGDPIKADIKLSITSNNVVEFHEATAQQLGISCIPFQEPVDVDRLYQILGGATDFFSHLKQSGTNPGIAGQVRLECTKLVHSHLDENFKSVYKSDGVDLNDNGVITIYVDGESAYGFKLVNSSDVDLYVSIFYFDMSDWSIYPYYCPNAAQVERAGPHLPAKGSLTIGYGSTDAPPVAYYLHDGQDSDAGFLRVFLSPEYVDFSAIAQSSPFSDARSRFQPAGQRQEGTVWDSFTVTIYQKRPED